MIALPSEDSSDFRILVLDDNAFDRARVRRMISVERLHCLIEEVDCLVDMDVALNSSEFDVAILDYDLPDGTGHDALLSIRASARSSQAVSIMFTGNDTPDVEKLAYQYGCSSFLLKSEARSRDLRRAIINGLRPP